MRLNGGGIGEATQDRCRKGADRGTAANGVPVYAGQLPEREANSPIAGTDNFSSRLFSTRPGTFRNGVTAKYVRHPPIDGESTALQKPYCPHGQIHSYNPIHSTRYDHENHTQPPPRRPSRVLKYG